MHGMCHGARCTHSNIHTNHMAKTFWQQKKTWVSGAKINIKDQHSVCIVCTQWFSKDILVIWIKQKIVTLPPSDNISPQFCCWCCFCLCDFWQVLGLALVTLCNTCLLLLERPLKYIELDVIRVEFDDFFSSSSFRKWLWDSSGDGGCGGGSWCHTRCLPVIEGRHSCCCLHWYRQSCWLPHLCPQVHL